MADKKPPVEERWAEIDKNAKPSKAVSKDDMRPALTHGFIRHRKTKTFLCLTDSYVLVELPVHFDCPQRERKKALPEVGLSTAVLKALDRSRTGRFRVVDGLVEIEGGPALYRVETELQGPDTASLWPEGYGAKDNDGISAVAFNPLLLRQASEAMGVKGSGRNHAVKARFIAPLRPVLIEPLSADNGARGLLMPVRMAED